MKKSDIHIRDPYILPLPDERRYLLFGTTGRHAWSGPGLGFDCYESRDLENWEGPIPAFRPPADFWSNTQFWAPECHPWQGRYYLLASFAKDGRQRGTQILVAEKPEGPYRLHSDGPVTPRDWECLDGTLFVDDTGTPWMVFCREWVQVGDGEMCAIPLTGDLRATAGEPTLLFRASEAVWSRPFEAHGRRNNRVTDGPFLHRLAGGKLLMLWSTVGCEGYAMGYAVSDSGNVLGPWQQKEAPIYGRDGGHGMLFHDFDGRLWMTLHHPNNSPNERPLWLEAAESGEGLALNESSGQPAVATGPRCLYTPELKAAGLGLFDKAGSERPSVGAIRWDAWTGGEVTRQVEKTLGPLTYQPRLPWFAQVNGDRDVRIAGNQETMDQEIAFAADAGLDYWAFLLYPAGGSMSDSLRFYLDSAKRRRINFCLILHNAFGVSQAQWPRERDRALALLREPGYQTVCGGRPLVYVFEVKHQGVFPEARFAEFRHAAKRDGLDPYCVYMGWNPKADFSMAAPWGFEAVSHYAACSADAEFAQLVRKVETDYWAAALAAQVPYVPLATTGWDKHPRRENPVSWERDHDYHAQAVFPATATPDEIARHLGDACAFVRQHPTLCPANTVILYAWNEHDEGGWLCPTWTAGGAADSRRLRAIATISRGEAARVRPLQPPTHKENMP